MKRLKLLLILFALMSAKLWSFTFEKHPWFEVTIPINFSYPDFRFSGAGIEMNFFLGEPNFGFGGSLVFGRQSYLTFNTSYMLSIPYVDPLAVPLTLRLGLFADAVGEDQDLYDLEPYLGFSTAAGLKIVGLPEWEFKLNEQTQFEWRYDIRSFIEEPSFRTFTEPQSVMLGNSLGFAVFDSSGGSGDGTYYYYTYY